MDRVSKALLQKDLIDDDEFDKILLTFPPLRLVFPRRLSVWALWRGATMLHEPCWNLNEEVAWRDRSCTVALIFISNMTAYYVGSTVFWQTFNKDTLEFILIIYHVASKRLVPQCLDVLHRQFIRQLRESHYIDVHFYNYIVCCVCLEQIVDRLPVRGYCALILTLMPLLVKYDACGQRSSRVALHEKV